MLETLGVRINPQKTRVVHVNHGFEFLGFKIKRGRQLRLPTEKIRSKARSGALYAYPRERSVRRFKDQIRARTRRRAPVRTPELIPQINPLVRGWGEHFKRAHVRGLFNRLDRWIVRRIWSHRFKRGGGYDSTCRTRQLGVEVQGVLDLSAAQNARVGRDGLVRGDDERNGAVDSRVLQNGECRAPVGLVASRTKRRQGSTLDGQREVLNDLRARKVHGDVPGYRYKLPCLVT